MSSIYLQNKPTVVKVGNGCAFIEESAPQYFTRFGHNGQGDQPSERSHTVQIPKLNDDVRFKQIIASIICYILPSSCGAITYVQNGAYET